MMMTPSVRAASDPREDRYRRLFRRNISSLALVAPLMLFIAFTASAGLFTPHKGEALDGEEEMFLPQINNYRAQNGLGPLTLNSTLDDVARWMANDMATHNY